jgi:oxygen-independent coproporphyrinogen-3 oxidase
VSSLPTVDPALLARLDVAGPRYTSYPTVPVWSEAFGPRQHAEALTRASHKPQSPLSLYVHVPFCPEMCTYCGCNVIISKDPKRMERYLAALQAELSIVASLLGARRSLSRLHLGGGTPTSLDAGQLERLWKAITDSFRVLPDAEVAVEVDPVITTSAQIALFGRLGFNRLSLGVQDFDPEVQRAVNRVQTVEQTRAVMDHARAVGFRSVNFDMIYGLPLQTAERWNRTLDQVLALHPDRVATYSFAYVPEAKPHQRKLRLADLPAPPDKLELLRICHERFVGAGYRAIGMDHFALPEDELSRALDARLLWRDFQGYTTQRAADTVAIGVSSISAVGDAFAQNVKSLARHEEAVFAGRLATEQGHRLSEDDKRRRDVITQLMCNFWVDLGDSAEERWGAELARLRPLADDGLVTVKGGEIAVTPLGRMFVRNVAMVFDAYLRRDRPEARPTFSRTV